MPCQEDVHTGSAVVDNPTYPWITLWTAATPGAAQCGLFAGFVAYFRGHGWRYARFRPVGPLPCRDRYTLLCRTEETLWLLP